MEPAQAEYDEDLRERVAQLTEHILNIIGRDELKMSKAEAEDYLRFFIPAVIEGVQSFEGEIEAANNARVPAARLKKTLPPLIDALEELSPENVWQLLYPWGVVSDMKEDVHVNPAAVTESHKVLLKRLKTLLQDIQIWERTRTWAYRVNRFCAGLAYQAVQDICVSAPNGNRYGLFYQLTLCLVGYSQCVPEDNWNETLVRRACDSILERKRAG